ncbi:MAG: tetratricopeptide repeat protein [Acidobacteriia bacterium]|nr:tetratricopeptide repeat protein [Terriglobia bacterium]
MKYYSPSRNSCYKLTGTLFLLLFLELHPPLLGQVDAKMVGVEKKGSMAYFHFSRGRLMEASGHFLQAERLYREALNYDPNSSNLLTELAEAYLRNNRVNEAVQAFEKSVQVNKGNLRAYKKLGAIYLSIFEQERNRQRIPKEDTLKKTIRTFESIIRLAPKDSNAYLVVARLYRYLGKPSKAIEILKNSLQIIPFSEETLTLLGRLYMDQNQIAEAIQLFENALKINSNSPMLLLQTGLAYQQLGDHQKAAEIFRRGLDDGPNSQFLRKNLAAALMDQGQIDEAETEYLKVVKKDPKDGEAFLGLGTISLKRQLYEQALQHLKKANAYLPNNVEASYKLAKLHEDLGHLEEAQNGFEQLLRIHHKSNEDYTFPQLRNQSIFLTHLGLIAKELGNFDKATNYFEELKTLGTKNDNGADQAWKEFVKEKVNRSTALLIDLYRDSKQISKALSVCGDVNKNRMDMSKGLRALCADVIAESGNPSGGLKQLQNMLEGNKGDLEVYHYIFQIYQRQKKYKKAEEKLYEAREYFSKKESFYFMLGALQERQKKYKKAARTFKKVINFNSKHASALNYLGYMWADRGVRLNESLGLIKRAVAIEPNNGAFLDSLGWVYFKMGKIEQAEAYLVQALGRVRRDPTIYEHLGDLYYQKGAYLKAHTAWKRSISYGQDEEEIQKVAKKVEELETKLALSGTDK